MLNMPPALLEKMSLGERFTQAETLHQRFVYDFGIYDIREDLTKKAQEYFESAESMKKNLVSFMAQIKPQVEFLSGIMQGDGLEDKCSKKVNTKMKTLQRKALAASMTLWRMTSTLENTGSFFLSRQIMSFARQIVSKQPITSKIPFSFLQPRGKTENNGRNLHITR